MPITALPTPPSRQDPTNFAVRADEFLGQLPTFATEANATASDVNTKQTQAAASATAAATSATNAANSATAAATSATNAANSASSALNAPGTSATSTTSIAIGTGSKTFTIQTGKAFSVGQFVVVANTPTPTNYMQGQITAHDSGTGSMTVNVLVTGGSGTFTAWTVSLAALAIAGVSSVSAGTTGLTPSVATTGAVTLAGTLNVANGGTGSTTAAGARTNLSAAASGANSDITSLTGLTTALSAGQGGTGQTTYAVGDILYASATGALSKLADVAVGNALISGGVGVAPSYGKIGLTTHVSGTLPVANGGTGVTTSTGSGSVVLSTSPSLTTPSLSGFTRSVSATVTAGTNAQGQVPLTSDYNVISSTPNNPSGVTLPTATVGRKIIVVNRGSNPLNVYPATGATIDAIALNTAISVPVGNLMEFNAATTTQWYSTYQLNTGSAAISGVTTFSAGTTGLTPNTATNGAVTLGGTLSAVNGGTGLTSYTAGDLIVASTGTTLTKLAAAAANNVLLSQGTGSSPTYGKVGLTTHVSGTLPVANGGTGGTTAADARTNLGATTVGGNLFTLTNPSAITFPRFNADNTVSALDAATFRTAIGAGTSSTTGTVTSVSGTGTVSGLTLSGTVTTSGNLTLGGTLTVTPSDFASQTANTILAAPNGAAGVPTFRALVAADIPTLNQNTTGTASNVTGTVAVANGGTGSTTAAGARTNLGATTLGNNLFTITNPSAVTFPRFNADNTVSSLDAATFRTAIGAGTGSGTVTSVSGTGTVNGITLTGTVTSTGNLTLGGTLSGVSLATQVTGTLPIANGGTGATTAATARTNLGATTLGGNLFTLANVAAISFPRFNADNTVSSLDAATFRTAIGAGTSSTTGTVTSVSGTGTVSGLTLSGTVTSSGNLTLGGTLAVTPSNFASQTANTILAAPNGAAGVPTFRALVAADIPTLNQNTTGTASNVTGTVAVANGGTGQTTVQAAINALAGAVTSGQYLRGDGTNVVMSAIQAADVPTLNQNTTGTAANVTGTVAVANGGTGANTLTGVVIGNGTSAFTVKTNPTGAFVGTTDTQTLSAKTIEAGTFTNGYTEETVTANTGTAYGIALTNGSVQILTLTGNVTFTFPTPVAGQSFTLITKQDATGGRSITWPASVKWPSATNPTITSTASKVDKFVFTAIDGSSWLGSVAGLNYTA